ncbi:MAG: peptidoglycan-binding protein [Sulfuricella sp.]|nr:peptidoglycan-binding protein [Sulfuricella sp.]
MFAGELNGKQNMRVKTIGNLFLVAVIFASFVWSPKTNADGGGPPDESNAEFYSPSRYDTGLISHVKTLLAKAGVNTRGTDNYWGESLSKTVHIFQRHCKYLTNFESGDLDDATMFVLEHNMCNVERVKHPMVRNISRMIDFIVNDELRRHYEANDNTKFRKALLEYKIRFNLTHNPLIDKETQTDLEKRSANKIKYLATFVPKQELSQRKLTIKNIDDLSIFISQCELLSSYFKNSRKIYNIFEKGLAKIGTCNSPKLSRQYSRKNISSIQRSLALVGGAVNYDGYWGSESAGELMRLQAKRGLNPTGDLDEETIRIIFFGDEINLHEKVRNILINQNYGTYSDMTLALMSNFQKKNGLYQDGILDVKSYEAINKLAAPLKNNSQQNEGNSQTIIQKIVLLIRKTFFSD